MRTRWTVSGIALVVFGAAALAVALGAAGFHAAPLHLFSGMIGGTALSMGSLVLFFERKDSRL